jgi:DNA invertase Pin-like site-specific DNA recombinase
MTDNELKDAIFYGRVSDVKQATVRGDTLHSQERTCREYAEKKGYAIREVFTDTLTGAHTNRPGLQAMLAYIRQHRGTIIIVDHSNRLGRDMLSYLMVRQEIKDAGGILESPVMGFEETSSDQLVEHVIASVNQYQRQHNAEQTKSRMRARVSGRYWALAAPVGYCYERVTGRGKILVRNEPIASVVQEALEALCFRSLRKASRRAALSSGQSTLPERQARYRSPPARIGYAEAMPLCRLPGNAAMGYLPAPGTARAADYV